MHPCSGTRQNRRDSEPHLQSRPLLCRATARSLKSLFIATRSCSVDEQLQPLLVFATLYITVYYSTTVSQGRRESDCRASSPAVLHACSKFVNIWTKLRRLLVPQRESTTAPWMTMSACLPVPDRIASAERRDEMRR